MRGKAGVIARGGRIANRGGGERQRLYPHLNNVQSRFAELPAAGGDGMRYDARGLATGS